jgi:hypothetical protein
MADLKLELWEVLRLGTMQSALSKWDVERAAQAGIPNEGLVCVRFFAAEQGCITVLSVIIDGSNKTTAETIEEARLKVVAKRVNID